MTVKRWSDDLEEMLPRLLEKQRTLSDIMYETFMTVMQVSPTSPPMSVMVLVIFTPSPVLGEGYMMSQGVFPIGGQVSEELLEGHVRSVVEQLAQERSARLTANMQAVKNSSPESRPSGLILGR